MLKLKYYKTNVGIFFAVIPSVAYHGGGSLESHGIVSVDGQPIESIEKVNGWYKIEGELKDFMKRTLDSCPQIGWKLKNPKLASEELPETLKVDQIVRDWNEDGEVYIGSHGDYHSLYEPVHTVVPGRIEPIEVEAILIREIDVGNYSKPAEMKVEYREGSFNGKKNTVDLSRIVNISEIETLLTPEFMLHTRPCSLTSQQVYQIVREYIISNIDGTNARIDSNFDFCFSVVKKVQVKPYNTKKEVKTRNNNSYRPPRFATQQVNSKDVKIFEMTWRGYKGNEGYQGYTCIEGWQAENLQELYDNMKQYLDELMQVINSPVKECQHCNGTGYECDTISTNER